MNDNLNKINQNVKYALSDSDIKRVLGNVKIICYPNLAKYRDIADIFDRKGRCVLFFEEDVEDGNMVGHWECLMLMCKTITFFDSYGLKPDECKKWDTKNELVKLKEYPDYLSALLEKAKQEGYTICYNPIKYQSFKGNVNTCGDYVCCRLLNKNMNGEQFKKYLDDTMKKLKLKTYDQTVSAIMLEKYNV